MSNTRLSNRAQLMRAAWACVCSCAGLLAGCTTSGTNAERSFISRATIWSSRPASLSPVGARTSSKMGSPPALWTQRSGVSAEPDPALRDAGRIRRSGFDPIGSSTGARRMQLLRAAARRLTHPNARSLALLSPEQFPALEPPGLYDISYGDVSHTPSGKWPSSCADPWHTG